MILLCFSEGKIYGCGKKRRHRFRVNSTYNKLLYDAFGEERVMLEKFWKVKSLPSTQVLA